MMNNQEIRWKQRFDNFSKVFSKLDEAVYTIKKEYADAKGSVVDEFLDDMLKEALIQRFEYTHELAWKVMKDYLLEVGDVKVLGSKDATRAAYRAGILSEGEVWMEMIRSRNMTSHMYNEGVADEIYAKIMEAYHPMFHRFKGEMEEKL